MKRTAHPAVFCKEQDTQFSGSMARHCGQWVTSYECPVCQRRSGHFARNYLAKGRLACTGVRFWLPWQQTIGALGHDNVRSLCKGGAA